MYNQPNKLLTPTSRVIKPYACAMIATEGPNILGKIDLAGIEIQYDTQYTSRIVLKANAVNQPLLYGFLGNDVTFLLLKITYDELNPRCLIEEEQYIEYFFKDNPSEIRYIHKMMLLSGNSIKRIPQIYLNNKNESDVVIDIMVANLPQVDLDSNTLPSNVVLIPGIYHNNILTDSIYNSSTGEYGSSQFSILDYEGNYCLYLNYIEINTIQLDETSNKIIIDTKSDTIIHLQFLSRFEMYQGYSRIDWVLNNQLNRRLTRDLPSVDNLAPVFNIKNITPIIENIYTFNIETSDLGEFIVTKNDIINYFISTIVDDRDGEISTDNLDISIRKFGELQKIDVITQEGGYDIIMQIKDNAYNQSIINYTLVVDVTKPSITFKSLNDTYNLSLENDGILSVITKNIIINKTINSTSDNIDLILSTVTNSDLSNLTTKNVIINIFNQDNDEVSEIINVGTYEIKYFITDLSQNTNFYTKSLIISE